MQIKIKFMELHKPFFLGSMKPGESSTNFGEKLYSNHAKARLEMCYDDEEELYFVASDKGVAAIEKSCVAFWAPEDTEGFEQKFKISKLKTEPPKVAVRPPPQAPKVQAQIGGPNDVRRTAQVETPMDKVQGRPGRKPKYQGEETQD